MSRNDRLPVRFLLVLFILAAASMACQAVTGQNRQTNPDADPQNQPQNQEQNQDQNQDQNPNQGQDPDQDQNPNQGDNAENTAEFELIGIWKSEVETGQGIVYTELLLEPTGTFSQTVYWNNLMTYDTGEYTILQNAVHFTVTRHEPTEYQGKELTWPNSFTYFVTPIDATSMMIEDRIMNTSWTMYKTGP